MEFKFNRNLKSVKVNKITNILWQNCTNPCKIQIYDLTHPKGGEADGNDEETDAVHDEGGGVVVVSLKADVCV